MLLDYCYAVGVLEVLAKTKPTTFVRNHEYFIPTKFHQNPLSGSGEKVKMRKVHGRKTDDALYDNSSLEPSAQVS